MQLITDYAPWRDFELVTTSIEGTTLSVSTPAASDRSYGRAVRVATFEGLPAGRVRVSVSISSGGRTVQTQPRFALLTAGQRSILTVTLTRNCEGVACPGADRPTAIACLGGLCVDPECSPEHPELCAPSCAPACAMSLIACVDRVCRPEGACVDEADDLRCPMGEICIAGEGCHAPFASPVGDAGTLDSGTFDAGTFDAGTDDAGTFDSGTDDAGGLDVGVADAGMIGAPRQIAPLSTSTSSSRLPVFLWELAPGTDGARVELCRDRACLSVIERIDAPGATSAVPTAILPPGVVFWRLFGRRGADVGTVPGYTWQVNIGQRSAGIPTSSGTTLDVNGDGRADVAIGAENALARAGRVYVYLGSATGLPLLPDTTLDAPDAGDFGTAVASAGDVNGDGYSDLAVGAPFAMSGVGRVYVYLGGAAGLARTPTNTLTGPDPAGNLGHAITSPGDVDGDGYADLAVAANGFAGETGRVHVYHGGPGGLPMAPTRSLSAPDGPSLNFGFALAGIGDMDADGYGDLAVGAYVFGSFTGRAYVYPGGSSGLPGDPTIVLTGLDGPNGLFGAAMVGGDVNGDGYSDLVVGASGLLTSVGHVYVYPGGSGGIAPSPMPALVAPDSDGYFGQCALSVGDVNGDGYADLTVGAERVLASTGRAYVYAGTPKGLDASPETTLTGPDGAGGIFGHAASTGDVDGDALADLIVTAPVVATETGSAYLYLSVLAGIPARTLIGPDGPNGDFGWSIASGD